MWTPGPDRAPEEGDPTELGRLQLLFRRASSLPQLPETALKLIHLIDEGESGARQLEQVISEDPALMAEILRHSAMSAREGVAATSVRQVIMRLGQYAVRSVASSLLVKLSLQKGVVLEMFDPRRFSERSVATAIVSRFLFARAQRAKPFESEWGADDMYAAGLLLSLPLALLAKVAPDNFKRTYHHAMRSQISFEDAFHAVHGASLYGLGADAARAWRLPPLFATTLSSFEEPWNSELEYLPLCCLNYANQLVRGSPAGMEPWAVACLPPYEVLQEVGLQPEESEALMTSVQAHLKAYGFVPVD